MSDKLVVRTRFIQFEAYFVCLDISMYTEKNFYDEVLFCTREAERENVCVWDQS